VFGESPPGYANRMTAVVPVFAILAGCAAPQGGQVGERTPFDPIEPVTDDSGTDSGAHVPRVGVGFADFGPEHVGLTPWFEALETPVIDCAAIPDTPTDVHLLAKPRAYHDVIFDAEGNLIGSDGYNLTASPDASLSSIWVPNTGTIEGMDWLSDGAMVAASRDAMLRIDPTAGVSVLSSAVGGYGVVVGPDGMIYIAGNSAILRMDPATGEHDDLVDQPGTLLTRVLEFSPDYSRMYFGGSSADGNLYAVDLDADLRPTGDAYTFVKGVGTLQDAMGVDVCGNVYVSDFGECTIYRVTPGRDVSVLRTCEVGIDHTHGLDWGSGLNDWRADAIYAAWPYSDNMVAEIVVGVPSRKYTGRYSLINAEE
jgi:hypothetical protein